MSNFRACKRVGAINSSSRRARVVYSLSFASFPFCFSLSPFLLPLLSLSFSLTHLAFSHLSPQPHSVPIVTFLSTAISSFSSPLILNPYSRSNCSAPRLFLSLLPSFFSFSDFSIPTDLRVRERTNAIYLSYFLSGVQARATLCTVDHPSPPVRRFASKFPYICTHHAVHLSSALSRFSRAHVSPFSRSF